MKRIIIGDPHGRWNVLKSIYNKEQPDEVIILGDYFDSFNINAYDQRDCYDNIIALRKEHLSKKKGRFIFTFIWNRKSLPEFISTQNNTCFYKFKNGLVPRS